MPIPKFTQHNATAVLGENVVKTGIAFTTRDCVPMLRRTIVPLLRKDCFDLVLVDGSDTEEGQKFHKNYEIAHYRANVRGGSDPAIAYVLSEMLRLNYDYIGLVENDVLLDLDWFEPTLALFEKGKADGLEVGAVSARTYEDRILIQRDGYAVMHNLGAGMVIFSRKAAELVLHNFRTGFTTENRRAFMQVSGLDIARWSPFAASAHPTCADWQFDRVLAQHGLVSLALTPAKCQMIGQEPPLEEQGLTLVTGPVEARRNDKAFDTLITRTALIRNGDLKIPDTTFLLNDDSNYTIFPHQIEMLGGGYEGDWQLKWCQGHGPFAWKAGFQFTESIHFDNGTDRVMTVPISGPCSLIVSGGEHSGKVTIADEQSGFEMTQELPPEGPQGQAVNFAIPGNIAYRTIRLTALTPGICFYGLVVREPQPIIPSVKFDHSRLPPP